MDIPAQLGALAPTPSMPRKGDPRLGRRVVPFVVFVFAALFGWNDEAHAQACPTSGHDVTLSSACTFSGGTYTFTGTLTISAAVTAASNVGNTAVILVADHINLTAAGSILADGRGFAGGQGPSSSTNGQVGGGHGGIGGSGTAVHGSITEPITLGSGGGSASGGAGGGAVKLQASGTLTINGTVSANGNQYSGTASGGAGGSVWLVANTLAGSGLVRVNGGLGWNSQGGGAGGRIAVDVQSDTSTLISAHKLTAFGSNGTAGPTYGPGGAGTVWTRVAPEAHGVLRINNNSLANGVTPTRATMTLDGLVIRQSGHLRIESPHVITLAAGGFIETISSAQLTIQSGATFAAPSSTTELASLSVTLNGSWLNTTQLLIYSGTFTHNGTFNPALQQLTVGSGGTFARSGTSLIELDSVLVQNGGTLTHTANTTTEAHKLSVRANTITIDSGGNVNLDGRGYAGGSGPASSTNGNVGGGHGGLGGAGTTFYGDITQPITLGSAGGSANGGAGGGAVKLECLGTLTVNGTISANGLNYTGTASGGAGGSVWLSATTLLGSGQVRSNGGQGWNSQSGGAGGRIAVDVGTDASTLFAGTRLQALGSYGTAGTNYGPAGAGTIWTRTASQAYGVLRIDNAGLVGPATPSRGSLTLDGLVVRSQGFFRIDSPHVITLDPAGSITGSGTGRLTIQSGATLVAPTATTVLDGLQTVLYGTWQTTTSLTILNGSFVHGGTFTTGLQALTVGSAATFSRSGNTPVVLNTLVVQNTGLVTHEANTTAETHKLIVEAQTITVETGGSIAADGRGYSGGNGPSGSNNGAVGGSHGGLGGANSVAHGSITEPTTFGSAGGSANGGAGGGAIKLVVAGTLTIQGTVSSNGLNYTGTASGGAGGSIWLVAHTVLGAGTIRANAGQGWNSQSGGGGGRIALDAQVDSSSLLSGTRLQATGNYGTAGPTYGPGGAGTIWTRIAPQAYGQLRVDNGGLIGSVTPSRGSMTLDGFDARNQGSFRVDSPHVITLETGGSITGSSSGRLTINSGATFSAPGAATVLDGLETTLYGTWSQTTDLTVRNGSFLHAGTFTSGLEHLTVGSAGSFTRSGTSPLVLGTLTIQSGGSLSHSANTNAESHKLTVIAETVTVASGGSINIDGRGYSGGNGPGTGTSAAQGGGHGGLGGGTTSAYGVIAAPIALGSGGGTSNGGAGGGALKLEVSGTLTVDGTLSANGGPASGATGGGSGGSIWVVAGTLVGGGTIRANGSQGFSTYGGGAGGRVALDAATDQSSLLLGTRLQAYGNYGSAGTQYGHAGAGTVWTRVAPQAHGTLRIDNNNVAGVGYTPSRGNATFDGLTVRNAATFRVESGQTLTVTSAITGSQAGSTQATLRVESGATLGMPMVTELDRLDLIVVGSLTGVSDMRVTNATWNYTPQVAHIFGALTLGGNAVLEYGGTKRIEIIGKLDLQSNAILRHMATSVTQGTAPGAQHILDITASEATIAAAAMIDLNGRGYNRGAGPGRGTSGATAGGGGHGGAGGQGSGAVAGGAPNGSASMPTDVGSGGGEDTNSNTNTGGAGGGLLELAVCGTLTVNGTIRANGEVGESLEGGGGSGGGIRIDTGVFVGTGPIQANGGQGAANGSGGGGGGGGGRIAISYGARTHTGSIVANGGARGGTGAATAGANGSIEQAERVDAVCENPPCGVGLCAGSWNAANASCDYAVSNGVNCSDGNSCTTGDSCQAGTCAGGEAVVCDDGNACTNDACDAQLGCRYTSRAGSCDDQNACTQNTVCINSTCAGGTPTNCNDNNACTADACDPVLGCASTPLSNTSCSDNDPCTTNDLCTTGVCGGTPLEVAGCFGAFPGPPVIGPAIARLVSRDGAPVQLDLTSHENDYEDGPLADGNALVWSIEDTQPWLYDIDFDPQTETLSLTPIDPNTPFSTVFTVTLVDSDGLSDTQVVVFDHITSTWLLDVVVAEPSLRTGLFTEITATLSSPAGRSVANRLVELELGTPVRGFLASRYATTNGAGVATFRFDASAVGPQPFVVRHTDGNDTVTTSSSLEVVAAANDVSVFTLDLSFFDPLTGLEVFPGDIDPISAGVPLGLKARVHNLGLMAAPSVTVVFTDRLATAGPLSEEILTTLTTPPLDPGAEVVLTHITSYASTGFHLFGVQVDPDNDFVEDDETNNLASQGFWIGTVTPGGGEVIAVSCELAGSFVDQGQPAVYLDEEVELSGRADYAPFLPFDPDGSLGIAGVRGGRVALTLFDDQGQELAYDQDNTPIMPVAGNGTTHRALHTIGLWDGVDQGPIGHFPNRSGSDAWVFPPPSELGCYTVRACVDDTSHSGCCEKTFCVVARGADLSCETPVLPRIDDDEVAPSVGVATSLSAVITNDGDVAASPVRARLLVDGVAMATHDLGTVAGGESKVATFDWTPTCDTSEVAVEVDFEDLVPEVRENDNRCGRSSTNLVVDRIVAGEVSGCSVDFGLVQLGMGGMPRPVVGGAITLLAPSGATETLMTDTGLGTLTAGPFTTDEAGLYTITARLDTPHGVDVCGVAAESEETSDNTLQITACADPSPWRSSEGANDSGLLDLAFSSTTLQYDVPVEVTATLTNHGLIPLSTPVEVLLTTSRGPLLETDSLDDIKTLSLSCADPLLPGATKTVTWTWTPRFIPGDGGPELRDLRVVVDPQDTLVTCAGDNDTTPRDYTMNLTATLAGGVVGLGPNTFQATVGNSGNLVPHGEGGFVSFAFVRASGARVAELTESIDSPAPGLPEAFTFVPTLDTSACDPADPIVSAQVTADSGGLYLESSENDNSATVYLPNLIPTGLAQEHDGCESRFFVEVEDAGSDPRLPVGPWYAHVVLTPPNGAPTDQVVGPFSGVGRFEILSNIETTSAGNYQVSVTIDGRDTSACGDLFESNELDNTLVQTFSLCDDPSVEVVGADLQVSGPVRWGDPFTVTGYVHNAGDIALTGDVEAVLALADRPLTTVDGATRTVSFTCQDPLLPGQSRAISWQVTLEESEGISAFVMTLDPEDDRTDECSSSNNLATRSLWFDLSPWSDYRGENFGAGVDVELDQVGFGGASQASYEVHVRPPNPSADEPPIAVGPRGNEGAISTHTWVSQGGVRTVIGTSSVGTPVEGLPAELAFTAAAITCDRFDPPSHLEVAVDSEERLAENNEANNRTTRNFPNLTLGSLERGDVSQSRIWIDGVVGQSVGNALPHPAFTVGATLAMPSGATTPLSALVSGPGLVRIGADVLVKENGFYRVDAQVDPETPGADCGVVAEQNENDNLAMLEFALCPDVVLTASFLQTPAFDVATPIEVELENVGNTTLIEDVALEVRGFTLEGAQVALVLDPPAPVISASPGSGVDADNVRTTVFTWTPSAATARVARFEIRATVLDTVSDNGVYADAECHTDNNLATLTTTLDQGCRATINFGTWQACTDDATVTVNLSRPDSGAPITPEETNSITATLEPTGGVWPAAPQTIPLSQAGVGVYAASMVVPPEATFAALRGRVVVQTADGASCEAQADTVVQPGVPDLSVRPSDIHFDAKNGDTTPFVRANLGDALDLHMTISNDAAACQARNVVGTASIELGFGSIQLGTWSLTTLNPGESKSVVLNPNTLLPVPPSLLGGGLFRWFVTAPSPWLHVFKVAISGAVVLDTTLTDNAATRSLLVGDLGSASGLSVTIVDPSPGLALVANSRRMTTLRVEDDGGDPVAPAELARFSLFALDGEGGGVGDEVTIDLLTSGTYLGDGLYETEIEVALPQTRTLELVAMAGRLDGATGGDEGTYPVAVGTVCFDLTETATTEEVGTHGVEVVLTLPEDQLLSEDLVVTVVDLSGSATPGLDYVLPATVTFPAGAANGATALIDVTLLDDGSLEEDETIIVSLEGGEQVFVCDSPTTPGVAMSHTITVVDDDLLNCPCDDGNACTIDRCDETGACSHLPVTPRPIPDATCNGADDDCDGTTDEDFVGTPEVCGENACAQPETTQCVAGQVKSGCDPMWGQITLLGDDVCPPTLQEEVAYAIAYDRGQPVGTIRCYNRIGDPTPVRCDTEADGVTLVVYQGLYCPL